MDIIVYHTIHPLQRRLLMPLEVLSAHVFSTFASSPFDVLCRLIVYDTSELKACPMLLVHKRRIFYTRRNTDGIFGEIMAESSAHTLMKKKCSDVNLSTNPFFFQPHI